MYNLKNLEEELRIRLIIRMGVSTVSSADILPEEFSERELYIVYQKNYI